MIVVYNTDGKIVVTCNSLEPIESYIKDKKLKYVSIDEELDLINFEYSYIEGEFIKGNPVIFPTLEQ